MGADAGVAVRPATADELPAVCNVLDGGLLEVDADVVSGAVDDSDVLVAVREAPRSAPILGALVLDGEEILAVAVRRRRRGQGIGSALVEAALEDRDELVAGFDERVRPFWKGLGFEIEDAEDAGRYRGRRSPPSRTPFRFRSTDPTGST